MLVVAFSVSLTASMLIGRALSRLGAPAVLVAVACEEIGVSPASDADAVDSVLFGAVPCRRQGSRRSQLVGRRDGFRACRARLVNARAPQSFTLSYPRMPRK